MHLRLTRSVYFDGHTHDAGDVLAVDDHRARRLVESGAAEPVAAIDLPEVLDGLPIEQATASPAPEQATLPRPGQRTRKAK